MANPDHLSLLEQGVTIWNRWRQSNSDAVDLSDVDLKDIDLAGADLSGADLTGVNLSHRNLRNTNFTRATLSKANLSYTSFKDVSFLGAWLDEANLSFTYLDEINLSLASLEEANLSQASLEGSNLTGSSLEGVNLRIANLRYAILREANLTNAQLIGTNFQQADLTDCEIYGISAWDLKLEGAIQNSLVITPTHEPRITVDDLEVAQFIYLILNNQKIRKVIDTITSKVVLILGRFTEERKKVLDALREELRKWDYSPVIFDFEKPHRDLTETASTLAHMSRFIIADLTDAKSIPQELQAIIPNLTSVPVQPLLLHSDKEYALFERFYRYPWVLPIYRYSSQEELISSLVQNVIEPVERKKKEIC